MSNEINKYIKSIKLCDVYSVNYNNLISLSNFLSDNIDVDIYDEFDVCYKIMRLYPDIYKIVKVVVDGNFNVIKSGNISSLNSNNFFIQFVQIYCIDNGIDIFSKIVAYDDSSKNINVDNYYFNTIRNHPLLSKEEEINLFKLYECADESGKKLIRDKIVYSNLRFVVSIVSKYYSKLPFEDLIQEGNFGLMEAVENYDYKKGARFTTYAFHHIRKRLIRAIKNQSNNIRIPDNFHDKIKLYKNFVSDYQLKYGVIPSNKQIVSDTGLSSEDITIIIRCLDDTLSLDEMIAGDEKSADKYNFIPDESADVEKSYDNNDLKDVLSDTFRKLKFTDQQIDILVLRYGLDGSGVRTLDYIGKKYNISRERVRQIIIRLLIKIRCDKHCLKLLADYMPSSGESFDKAYLKRRGRN